MPYQKNNIEYPSVTTVLSILNKEGLLPWVANCTIEAVRDSLQSILFKNPTQTQDKSCAIKTVANTLLQGHVLDDVLKEAKKAYKDKSNEALIIGTLVHTFIEQHIKRYLNSTAQNKKVCSNKNFTEKDFISICTTLTSKGKKLPFALENAIPLKGKMKDIFLLMRQSVLSFSRWAEEQDVKWQVSEQILFNEQIGYAGTCDALAFIGKQFYLLDFKTSKSIYEEHRLQLAAYKAAYLLENNLSFLPSSTINGNNVVSADNSPKVSPKIAIVLLNKESGELQFIDIDAKWHRYYIAFVKLIDYYYLIKQRRLKHNPFVLAAKVLPSEEKIAL